MRPLNRRRFLARLGVGATLASATRATSVPSFLLPLANRDPDIETIAAKLRACSRGAAMAEAVNFVRQGATWQQLLGATLLAGAREIKPQPMGNSAHAMMMVESAFQLAEASPEAQHLLPVLFNIDCLKRGQQQDRDRGWVLCKPPTDGLPAAKEAPAALAAAMREWNSQRADRAIVGLYAGGATAQDEVFEELWPFGAQDFWSIGHKMIYLAQAYRALARIGWQHAQPVLRSVVFGLLDGPGRGQQIAPYRTSLRLAGKLGDGWQAGRPRAADSARVLARLRHASVTDAQSAVVEFLAAGMAPATVWDGYRLLAAEMLSRLPGIVAVHPTTSVNAMYFAWRRTRRDRTRRLVLLQSAAWLALFRGLLEGRGMKYDLPGIETWTADEVPELANASDGNVRTELEARIRKQVFQKGDESHAYKYAAAVLEDVRLCDPVWAPRILVAGCKYLPTSVQRDADVFRRARKAVSRLPRKTI